MFSPKSYILAFKLDPFWKGSEFTLLHVYPVFPSPFVKKNVLIKWSWHSCQKSVNHKFEGLFLGSVFYWPVCLFLSWHYSVFYCRSFIILIWNWEVCVPTLSYFSRLFWLFGIPWNSIWVLVSSFILLQKAPLGIW